MKKFGVTNIILSAMFSLLTVTLIDPQYYWQLRPWFLKGLANNFWAQNWMLMFCLMAAVTLCLIVYLLYQYSKKVKAISFKRINLITTFYAVFLGIYSAIQFFFMMESLSNLIYVFAVLFIPFIITAIILSALWLKKARKHNNVITL